MNKQDKDKAIEISGHCLQIVDCFAKTHYDEDDILSTARDAAIEMAAWKEQQMIEKAVYKCAAMLHKIDDLLRAKGLKGQFEDEFDEEYKKFKKAMED